MDACVDAFLASIAASLHTTYANWPKLRRELSTAIEHARQRWPGTTVSSEEFARYLAERIADTGKPELPAHSSDLWLTAAWIKGDDAAIKAMEGLVTATEPALHRLTLSTDDIAEAKQILRERMLEADKKKMRSYRGSGPLASWLKVVAGRIGLELIRSRAREETFDEVLLGHVEDALHRGMQDKYHSELRAAFRGAVTSLPERDREILRCVIFESMPVQELARRYEVHRVTMARWLAKIRELLVKRTRSALTAKLRLTPRELNSALNLLESRFDVSLTTVLSGDS